MRFASEEKNMLLSHLCRLLRCTWLWFYWQKFSFALRRFARNRIYLRWLRRCVRRFLSDHFSLIKTDSSRFTGFCFCCFPAESCVHVLGAFCQNRHSFLFFYFYFLNIFYEKQKKSSVIRVAEVLQVWHVEWRLWW